MSLSLLIIVFGGRAGRVRVQQQQQGAGGAAAEGPESGSKGKEELPKAVLGEMLGRLDGELAARLAELSDDGDSEPPSSG